jgi:FkbM family methyltransferase
VTFHTLAKSFKGVIVRLLAWVCRAYLSRPGLRVGRRWLWRSVVKPFLWWRAFDFAVTTRFGSKIVGNTGDTIQRFIYYFGIREPNLTHWIGGRLALGDVFVDVGANIGYYSLLAARLVGHAGSAIAIEASPSTFALLSRNIELNQARNVRAVNLALWDTECELDMYDFPDDSGRASVMRSWADHYKLKAVWRVQAKPLSAILSRTEISSARLFKVDIEGAEWQAASSLISLLPSLRPDAEFVIEVTDFALQAQGKEPSDLLELFTTRGFHAYRIENDYSEAGYIRWTAPARPTRIRNAITGQNDVIFSRVDAERL